MKGPYILTGKNCTPVLALAVLRLGLLILGAVLPSGGSASGGSTVGGISATEGGGWYSSEGHVRPFGLTSGLKETISDSALSIKQEVKKLRCSHCYALLIPITNYLGRYCRAKSSFGLI